MSTTDTQIQTAGGEKHLSLRESLGRLSVRPRSVALLALLPVLAVVTGVLGWVFDWRLGVDSAVYRAGALTLLQGEPLYEGDTLGSEPWWALLPFTYPPAAALLFTPLAFFPVQVAWGVVSAVSFLALALVVRVTIASLPRLVGELPRWASPARATLIFTIVFFGLEPVWRTVFLGQINIILMALVMLDVLVVCRRDSRWGGVLVGVAAAVKLTPLIFIPHLLFTGRKWDAARALATFAGLQALMFVIVPADATRFWTHTVFNQGRIGPMHWAGNQSLNGLLNRVTDLAPWASTAALGIGALLAPFAVWVMLRFHRRGQHLYALLVTAFYALLVSPVSWSHHWVWAVPLIVALVARLPRTNPTTAWRSWVLAGSVTVVFVSCVLLVLPNGRNLELHWEVWQFVLGSAYLLVPVMLATALGIRWLTRRRRIAVAAAGADGRPARPN
ncbi:glycosyltransferase 87 family protein [Saccharomonospora viridis]|uniref:Membrane protein n=1 Tax=Saccharomonospora viridis TaxID=1852 RepID=A0A837D9K5_9PSEU|nr:glycosyltransferase 87 family protein [Saccharomonospora viridis]KHF43885.1 membrane protein [Saccharomonospora viridis]SFP91579.1 alpha-1,2-mannosyltransferase [Saccharomonospora viridis]